MLRVSRVGRFLGADHRIFMTRPLINTISVLRSTMATKRILLDTSPIIGHLRRKSDIQHAVADGHLLFT